MSTKHTPGEWTTKEIGDSAAEILAENTQVAFVKYHNGEEEGRANARLIAAAPEMLECLKECVRIYEEARNAQPTGHLWPDPNHILHARRAIAAAEGDEQEQDKRAELDPATDPWLTDLLRNR